MGRGSRQTTSAAAAMLSAQDLRPRRSGAAAAPAWLPGQGSGLTQEALDLARQVGIEGSRRWADDVADQCAEQAAGMTALRDGRAGFMQVILTEQGAANCAWSDVYDGRPACLGRVTRTNRQFARQGGRSLDGNRCVATWAKVTGDHVIVMADRDVELARAPRRPGR